MRLNVARVALMSCIKRNVSLLSALNAFTTRRPPRVSSIWVRISAFCSCPLVDALFNERPIRPMSSPATGKRTSTNSVSCHEIVNSVIRYTIIIIGSLNNISNVDMILASTSLTSLVIRDITSPLRSSVKKPIGKLTTFW